MRIKKSLIKNDPFTPTLNIHHHKLHGSRDNSKRRGYFSEYIPKTVGQPRLSIASGQYAIAKEAALS